MCKTGSICKKSEDNTLRPGQLWTGHLHFCSSVHIENPTSLSSQGFDKAFFLGQHVHVGPTLRGTFSGLELLQPLGTSTSHALMPLLERKNLSLFLRPTIQRNMMFLMKNSGVRRMWNVKVAKHNGQRDMTRESAEHNVFASFGVHKFMEVDRH